MRWPWVSRDRLQAEALQWERLYDNAMERANLWRHAHDTLLDKYHALRLHGAEVVLPQSPLARPNASPIEQAITRKAGTDAPLRSLMWRAANSAKAQGVSELEIIGMIESGISDEISDDAGLPI